MDFKGWLLQTKIDEPDLEVFITKLEPFFTDAGLTDLNLKRKSIQAYENLTMTSMNY